MIVSLPLRGTTHRILIADSVTFADPAISPALTASERESVLAYVAAGRRTAELPERMIASAERGARRAAVIVAGFTLAGLSQIDFAQAASEGPLSATAGVYAFGALAILALAGMCWPWKAGRAATPDPLDDPDNWGAR